MSKVICLYGKSGSGKSLSAVIIKNIFLSNMKDAIIHSLAHRLKLGVAEMFGFTKDQVFGNLKDEIDDYWGITPRIALQTVGTDLFQYALSGMIPGIRGMETHNRWFWCHAMRRDIDKSIESGKIVVVDDMRFPHEELWFRNNYDAFIIRVNRLFNVEINESNHSSEKECDNITSDYVLCNDSDVIDLCKSIKKMIATLDENQ